MKYHRTVVTMDERTLHALHKRLAVRAMVGEAGVVEAALAKLIRSLRDGEPECELVAKKEIE